MEFRNLNQAYDGKLVLEHFDIEFPEKGVVCLLGKSGCGKTTLLRQLGTLLQGQVAYIFQEDRLLPWLTAAQNIDIVTSGSIKNKAASQTWLRLFDLEAEGNQRVGNLSGGQQRRIAIARALAFEKPILLMDEPFKGLDVKTRDAVGPIVFQDRTKLYILITHDPEEAIMYGDDIFVLQGPPLTIVRQIKITETKEVRNAPETMCRYRSMILADSPEQKTIK